MGIQYGNKYISLLHRIYSGSDSNNRQHQKKIDMTKLRKNGQRSRSERRRDAEHRQEYYNSLTPQQKLSRLPIGGESKKEKSKLENLVRFGRKLNEPATPSATKKHKNETPSRRERWENKKSQ